MIKVKPSEEPMFKTFEGKFEDKRNNRWGEESPPVETTVIGLGDVPVVGKPYFLFGIEIEGLQNHKNSWLTSTIQSVESTSTGFIVKTKNSVYVLTEE